MTNEKAIELLEDVKNDYLQRGSSSYDSISAEAVEYAMEVINENAELKTEIECLKADISAQAYQINNQEGQIDAYMYCLECMGKTKDQDSVKQIPDDIYEKAVNKYGLQMLGDGAVSFEQKFEIPFNMNDSCAEDEECELFNTTFGYRGTVLQPVRSASGFAFLDSRYLAPFLGEDYTVWKRNSLYVIKVGLLAKAFICPVVIQNDTPLVKELNQIIDFVTIKRQKEKTEEGNEQMVLK